MCTVCPLRLITWSMWMGLMVLVLRGGLAFGEAHHGSQLPMKWIRGIRVSFSKDVRHNVGLAISNRA